jgi:putative serine protease PepD
MSDTPDPYAARPYVPPTDRPDDEPGDAAPADARAEQPEGSAGSDPFTHRFEPTSSAQAASGGTSRADLARGTDSPDTPTSEPPSQEVPTAATYAADPHHGSTENLPPVQQPSTAGTQPPRSSPAVVGLLAAALIGGAAGVGGGAVYDKYVANNQSAISTLDAPVDNSDEDRAPAGAVEQVAARVLPSVVQINVSGGDVGGKGSGIIISSDGEILTNNNVVEVAADEDEGSIIVVFNDGSTGKAKILGRDPLTDTAVIKVGGKSGLPAATLGSSGSLRIGQPVIALGSPFGLSGSVTTGIVSALNRPANFTDEEGGAGAAFPSIQTDAAINPGNSGGPITDMQGRVVGISTGIAASLGGGFDGVAFALPIDLAKHVAKNLIEGKKIEHARIGITVAKAVADDNVTQIGAEVRAVQAGSAGAKAGLKVDDIVTAVDNHPIATNDALIATIRGYQPGQTVTIAYLRDGKKRTTKVTLDSDGGKLSQ